MTTATTDATEPRKGRRRLRRWIITILILALGAAVAPWAVSRARAGANAVRIVEIDGVDATAPQRERLRLVVYNIAHGRGLAESNWSDAADRRARLSAIARTLAAQDADLVVLNEVDFDASWTDGEDQAAIIAREAGFPYVVEQRNLDVAIPFVRWTFGNALLSRHEILDAEFVDLPARSPLQNIFAGAKHAMEVDVRLASGMRVRVIGTHLHPTDVDTRVRGARVLAARAAASPYSVVLLGDLNSSPSGFPGVDPNLRTTAVDVLLDEGALHTEPSMPGAWSMTFPSGRPERVIDWILVSSDAEIVRHEVLEEIGHSDHRPVLLEVRPPR